jgi:hypothetical protein
MGLAEYLAGAAVLIIIAVIGLLYSASHSEAAAARPPDVLPRNRTPTQPVTPRRGATTPPTGYSQPKWQYKMKEVPRFNSQLGRFEPVREMVLVFEE